MINGFSELFNVNLTTRMQDERSSVASKDLRLVDRILRISLEVCSLGTESEIIHVSVRIGHFLG